MLWMLLALACAPRIWQQTQWEGDDTMASGVLCQGTEMHEGADFWVRVSIRHHEEVEVDWPTAELRVVNAEIIDRTLGPERVAGPRTKMRYDSYVLRPVRPAPDPVTGELPSEGADIAAIGPYSINWRGEGQSDWVSWEAQGCTPRLH